MDNFMTTIGLAAALAVLVVCSFMLGVTMAEDNCPSVREQLSEAVQPYIVDINEVWHKVEGWADAR